MDWQNVTYLDLFSGVGGFTHGFLNAGMKFKRHYFSEIDKHSIAVYKYHFHEAEAVGDIASFSGDGIERPNLITFGFPCQDLSIAGKQAGLAGSRSGLFFQALRLIERFHPEVFIFENVAGLLSSNEGQDFEIVLRAIADLGIYECEWQLVNTRWVLPQNRERVYFVGHLAGRSKPRVFPFRENDREFIRPQGKERFDGERIRGEVSSTISARYYKDGSECLLIEPTHKHGDNREYEDCAPTIQARYGTGGDNVPYVMQINPSTESHGQQPYQQNRVYDAEGISPALHSLSEKMNISVRPILTPDREEKRQNGRRVKEDGEPAFTWNTQDRHGVVIIQKSQDYREDGTLREFNDCPTIRANMGDNAPMLVSNAVTPDAYLARGERDRDENGKAILTSMHHRRIRRLTEIECERLQGFPDNWTEYGNYDGVIKKVAKTQRYKQMGNAVTTLWPKLIAQRLMNGQHS